MLMEHVQHVNINVLIANYHGKAVKQNIGKYVKTAKEK